MGKSKSITLDVSTSQQVHGDPRFESRCCRPNMVVLPGYGNEEFAFPAVQDIVVSSLNRLEDRPVEGGDSQGSGKKFSKLRVKKSGGNKRGGDDLSGYLTGPKHFIPQTTSSLNANVDGTLFLAAEGLRLAMDDGKYDAIVAERFDDHADKVTWAKEHLVTLEPKYASAVLSLEAHLAQLRELYLESLPLVLKGLEAQNPEIPEHILLDAAIDSLDEELSQILDVLRIWTDAFGQLRSGNYEQLEAVVFAVEQAFLLFEGEDLSSPCGEPFQTKLKTSKYKVGNVFVARFSDQGPATIPGGRGPIGAHALEVPHDEQNIIALMLAIYMHEFRHDIFHDIEGLGLELTQTVASAIDEAVTSGEVKLSKEKANIGRNKVPLKDLLVKLFADTIGEVDADISGGVLLSGPAYLYNLISTFSAFNASQEVIKQNRLLRTGSYFGMQDVSETQKTVQFWPHPPDYIRAYIVAAALDEIGFEKEAEQCRALADQAVGTPIPEDIIWRNEDRESNMKIKIPVKDIVAVAPVVVKALMHAELETMEGMSTAQMINWTKHRQSKVDILVKSLMAGSSEVPTDKGDFYATYVAAASTIAYWGLCKSGVNPLRAAHQVNQKALEMVTTIKNRYDEALKAEVEAGCDNPGDDSAEPSADGEAKD